MKTVSAIFYLSDLPESAVTIHPKSASKIQNQLFSPPIGMTPQKTPFQTVPKVATQSTGKTIFSCVSYNLSIKIVFYF